MAEVRLERVTKAFGDVVAVREVSFTVPDGAFAVILGPSGCGKTTTLRMIAGLETPTSGRIYIGGEDVTDLPPKKRDIAMVFQNYALYPHMTVYDNMAFGLKMRGYPREEIRRRVEEAARILGLEHLLHRKPRELSGGQRQRVAVGRAIVRHPKVFLFDEPLSNLDAKLRVRMRAELARIHRKLRATSIYVTHDQVEAMTLGDWIILLKDGEIQQMAPPLELYHQPRNLFVAGFIGSPPMNFLRGRLEGDPPRFLHTDFTLDLPSALSRLRSVPSREVILGVRPEHWRLDPTGPVVAEVEFEETLGSEIILYLRLASGEPLAVRIPPETPPRPGERIRLRVLTEKVHVFDPRTGENLTYQGAYGEKTASL